MYCIYIVKCIYKDISKNLQFFQQLCVLVVAKQFSGDSVRFSVAEQLAQVHFAVTSAASGRSKLGKDRAHNVTVIDGSSLR